MTKVTKTRLLLLGPPGAGKGTQSKLLAETLGVSHVSSGNLFRQHLSQSTTLGLKAKGYMAKGVLVPDEITIGMVLEEVLSPKNSDGFVLDGFPRNLPQAEALDRALASGGQPLEQVLSMEVPEGELVKRLGGRLTCGRCQAPYNLYDSPPRVRGLCDRCGGELYQREDDSPQAVKKRIEVYRSETEPLQAYYQRQGKLRALDGVGPVEEVRRRLMEALKEDGLQPRDGGRAFLSRRKSPSAGGVQKGSHRS